VSAARECDWCCGAGGGNDEADEWERCDRCRGTGVWTAHDEEQAAALAEWHRHVAARQEAAALVALYARNERVHAARADAAWARVTAATLARVAALEARKES
jgi:hypothetical protein